LSKEVCDDNRARRQFVLALNLQNGCAQALRAHIICLAIYIDKDRRCAGQGNDFRRGAIGKRRAENGIAGADVPRHERQRNRMSAILYDDGQARSFGMIRV